MRPSSGNNILPRLSQSFSIPSHLSAGAELLVVGTCNLNILVPLDDLEQRFLAETACGGYSSSMNTARLQQLDVAHVWHPFTPMQEYAREATPVIAAGDGFYLWDTDGRRYLDGVSSLWCNIHGHWVPEIDAAIRAQLELIAHSTLLGLGNIPSIELAQALVQRAPPGLNRVFYSDDGSTAVEAALKLAWQFHRQKSAEGSQRDIFICLSGAYHGDTVGAVSVGGIDRFHAAYRGMLFPTMQIPAPVTYRTPPDHTAVSYLQFCFDELERVFREWGSRIAGLVIEPLVQAAAGMLVHPSGYLRRARELTALHGALLIADEVAVGFGRTGTLFACEQEQVTPDLLCLSKGLTGGYMPLAATLATEEVYAEFLGEPADQRTFYHGHTYTGNPLACATALASLHLFEKNNLLENVARCEAVLKEKLTGLADHPHVGEVRQKGIIVGIELVRDRATKEAFADHLRLGHKITLSARERGVLIRPIGDVIEIFPAPAMPPELVGKLCDVVFEAIDATLAAIEA